MAIAGYTFEAIFQQALDAHKNNKNIKTMEDREQYLRGIMPNPQVVPEEIRAAFKLILPDQEDCVISDPATIEARRQIHLKAFEAYVRLSADYGFIQRSPGTPRNLNPLYKPETDQEAIDYNNHLRDAFARQDYAEVGRLYSEHIMNLPSFDPEMIANLPAEEVPGMMRELYPLYVAVTESVNFLTDDKRDNLPEIRAGMSKESLDRLKEWTQYESLFSTMKTRCDEMFSPYYAAFEASKLPCTQANISTLIDGLPMSFNPDLRTFVEKLGSGFAMVSNGFGDNTKALLKNAGLDGENAVAWDPYGKQYSVAANDGNCAEVYRRGEPVFCTVGNQLKAFKAEGRTIVEVQPKQALDSIFKTTLTTTIKETDNLMNGSTAAPIWMFTGSSQYRRMQKAYAAYEKLVDGEPTVEKLKDPKAKDALEALKPAAEAYFKLKGVELKDYPDFNTFYREWPSVDDMSDRALARMMSAYKVLNTYNLTAGAAKTHEDLSKYPAYKEPLPVKRPHSELVREGNAKILESDFLNERVKPAGNSNVGEKLRQEIKMSLIDPTNGLLSKKFFTTQDRQVAEDVLAKAVILSMISSGRKAATPSAIEVSYEKNAAGTMDQIKKSEAFQNEKGKFISPDGLRNFLANNRQAEVNKSISRSAVKQQAAANAEVQPQPQKNMELNANAPQQSRQPVQPGSIPGIGG